MCSQNNLQHLRLLLVASETTFMNKMKIYQLEFFKGGMGGGGLNKSLLFMVYTCIHTFFDFQACGAPLKHIETFQGGTHNGTWMCYGYYDNISKFINYVSTYCVLLWLHYCQGLIQRGK